MYYLTDRNEHMDARCFGDLKLLIKTVLIDDEAAVINYINRNMKDKPISLIDIPYVGTLTIGEIVVNWTKQNGKWDKVVWSIAEGMEEEMLDTFADCWMNGEEEILYFGDYIITHD